MHASAPPTTKDCFSSKHRSLPGGQTGRGPADSAFKSAALGALTTLPPCPTVSSMAREDAEGVTLMPVSRLSCGRL